MRRAKKLYIKYKPEDRIGESTYRMDWSDVEWQEYYVGQIIDGETVQNIQNVLWIDEWGISWGFQLTAISTYLEYFCESQMGISVVEYYEVSSHIKHRMDYRGWLTNDKVIEDLQSIEVLGLNKIYQVGDKVNDLIIAKIEKRVESHYGLTDYYCGIDHNGHVIVEIMAHGKNTMINTDIL